MAPGSPAARLVATGVAVTAPALNWFPPPLVCSTAVLPGITAIVRQARSTDIWRFPPFQASWKLSWWRQVGWAELITSRDISAVSLAGHYRCSPHLPVLCISVLHWTHQMRSPHLSPPVYSDNSQPSPPLPLLPAMQFSPTILHSQSRTSIQLIHLS